MYAHYRRMQLGNNTTRYQFVEQVSLFGRNAGFITWLLALKTQPSQDEPYAWHLDIRNALAEQDGFAESTLIIDLKPKQARKTLFLYELQDVWGYSDDGWSPILLLLGSLFVDANPAEVDRNDFTRDNSEIENPVYEFLYLSGTVDGGKLTGTWAPPPSSPTNAALLLPKPLKYFFDCIRARTPDILRGIST